MKFGPLDVAKAAGTILAHSIPLKSGRLRKGAFLTETDVRALQANAIKQVTVAQLEAGDLDENTAAGQLARELRDQSNMRITEPFTGRCNIVADATGVVRIDADKIDAFNSIDPMITIATVPDYHVIDAGRMLATIKVISFAVPQTAIEKAAECLNQAITMHPPVMRNAALIVTQIGGGDDDKGVAAIRDRLARHGVELSKVVTCPHATHELAGVFQKCDADIVLILTASATSDALDVAPAALTDAGGQVVRFGMPVDPGNLLFLGQLGRTPVIGLPGCARSPSLNGADWVLSRVLCGVEVNAQDIAGMGVGGLLKEIPTRPQPRRKK